MEKDLNLEVYEKALRDLTLLAVTVDINERIHLARSGKETIAWVPHHKGTGNDVVYNKTNVPKWVELRGVTDARVDSSSKWVTSVYNKNIVATHASVVRLMVEYGVVRVLAPMYFIRGRQNSRICVRHDGVEISLLTLIGDSLGITDPSWKTTNCWKEDVTEVISQSLQPIGGSRQYSREYYKRTAE